VVALGTSLHRPDRSGPASAAASPALRPAEIGLWLRLVFLDYGEGPAGQRAVAAAGLLGLRRGTCRTKHCQWKAHFLRENTNWTNTPRADHAGDTERRTKDASTSVDAGSGDRQRHWLGLAGDVSAAMVRGTGYVSAAMVRGTGWGARRRPWVGVFFEVLVLVCSSLIDIPDPRTCPPGASAYEIRLSESRKARGSKQIGSERGRRPRGCYCAIYFTTHNTPGCLLLDRPAYGRVPHTSGSTWPRTTSSILLLLLCRFCDHKFNQNAPNAAEWRGRMSRTVRIRPPSLLPG
jgi:hypothetical protein